MISYSIVFWLSLVAIIPVSFWLIFFQKSQIAYWSNSFLLKVFWLGVLSSLLAVFLELLYFENRKVDLVVETSFLTSFLASLGYVFPIAVIEEFSKSLVIIWSIIRKKVFSLKNGLLLGILAGLSFAVTENGIYFARFFSDEGNSLSGNFWQVVFLRFIFSTSAHIIYSGLAGYFLAQFVLKKDWKEKIKSLSEVVSIPIFIHTAFNFFLETKFSWLIFLVVFGGLIKIFWLYSQKETDNDLISNKEVYEQNN